MAPTPSSKSLHSTPSSKSHHTRTPLSKRLNFTMTSAAEHPVEVIGRIRNQPESKIKAPPIPSALQINLDAKSLRLRTEIGYRDFSLDGVSSSEDDDLDGFYKKFVESRISGVKLGNKCTIMMYGPTGSGKSHTMFGCAKQPGIVYKSLRDILGDGVEEDGEKIGIGTFVQVTVLEIYNEEIYDLLSSGNNGGGGGFNLGWPKGGSASKVRLDVMGGKAKNATFISGNEAGKILKEIQKVEKRRIVKSTLCNERSSRSHCMIILDVPTVGGQLLLVDMAGSENIEQAGQIGLEAKLQTAKINQGNIALKRVVESIANGDSHVPFRDSKLTMLLQDSFEDDKSKILMILCASPDPKELHKTIATLEYGAKAKCIVRGPHTPIKDKVAEDSSTAVILGSRITALDQFIHKLQIENKLKEKECNETRKELKGKEEEVSSLRAKLAVMEGRGNERTLMLQNELERKIKECENMADKIVEMERRKMEEKMVQQQREVEMLRSRLEEIENELRFFKGEKVTEGSSFMKKLLEVSSAEESDMVKSMDLSKSMDFDSNVVSHAMSANNFSESLQNIPNKTFLTTVYEEEECENDEEEVQKEVIGEKKMIITPIVSVQNSSNDTEASREMRIRTIFTLCGNNRELYQHNSTHMPAGKFSESNLEEHSQVLKNVSQDSLMSDFVEKENNLFRKLRFSSELANDLKENHNPFDETSGDLEVYVKWEASNENAGQFITTLKVLKDSTLTDLRKLIEIHLCADQQDFTFLVLGDPSGAPVAKENEGTTQTTKLPICNNKLRGHLACLRPVKPMQRFTHLPFSPLENKIVTKTPVSHLAKKGDECCLSPVVGEHLSSTPFITVRRH